MSELTDKWRSTRANLGSIISQIEGKLGKLEAEEKRMEQKRDESYIQGAEDMRKAINMLYDTKLVESSSIKLEELFDTDFIPNILSRHSAVVIIDGVKQFLKRKEQEFKPGDEVEFWDTNCEAYKKYVIIKAEPDSNIIWLLNLKTFCRIWFDKDNIADLKKTGRHFDTIDIPEGGVII